MPKYNIHPDFRILKLIRMPRCLLVNRISNLFLRMMYKLQKINSEASCTRFKVQREGKMIVNVDLIVPKEKKPRPCLVYFPGGGFLMEATNFHKKIIADLAVDLDIAIAVVHYRLAPKFAFPTAFNDAIAAFEYIRNHSETFGIERTRIAVGGDSAGGSLAAGLCLYNQDVLKYDIKCALLVYPATGNETTKSRQLYYDTPMFHSGMFKVIRKAYFANGYFGMEKYAYPISHENHSGLPPTYIETAEFDPLHDEGIDYYHVLADNKIIVELNDTQGTVHGYDILAKSPIVRKSYKKRRDFLKRYL